MKAASSARAFRRPPHQSEVLKEREACHLIRRPLVSVSALILCSALALAGCSGSNSSSKTTTTNAGQSTTATTSPVPIQNNPQLRSQAVLTSCTATGGGWTASGTPANPPAATHTYLLTVYFTDSAATVIGSGTTSVTVPSNASGSWSVTANMAAPSTVKCVLVGVE